VMEFVFVKTLREAIEAAFGGGVVGWRRPGDGGGGGGEGDGVGIIQSRL
jgi:hypothetical protein